MGIINSDVFVKSFLASPVPKKMGSSYDQYYNFDGLRAEVVGALGISNRTPPAWLLAADEKSALAAYNEIRSYIVKHGYIGGKYLRPWNLDKDLTAKLDRKEVWWGWEFETGYQSVKDRGTVVGHCWDTYDGVIFDTEGEGNAAVEITFTPQERSKFTDGTAQALRFMNWLSDNRELTMKTGNANIGTHLNISHPDLNATNLSQVVQCMNRTVGALEQQIDGVGAVRQALFGRAQLYGGFFPQNQTSGVWMEGKLFRTTYNSKEFARYVRSAHAISDALEAIMKLFKDEEWKWQFLMKNLPYVTNLYEMATDGAKPVIRWFSPSGTNAISGNHNTGWELSTTLKKDKTPQTRADAEEEIKRKEEEERQRKLKEAAAKLAAEREQKEMKIRIAMNARGERPEGIPKAMVWCDGCNDWHDDEGGPTSAEFFAMKEIEAKAKKKAA